MAVNIAVCHGWAMSAPAGTRTRPIARLKPAKVVTPGSTANLTIPAKAAVSPVPTIALDGLLLLVDPARKHPFASVRWVQCARLASCSRECGARLRHDWRGRTLLDR